MPEFTQAQIDQLTRAARLLTRALDESMRADDLKNMAASSGTNDLTFERVESGRVLMIEGLTAVDDTSAPTRIRLGITDGVSRRWYWTEPAPLATESVGLPFPLRVREGWAPIARIEGATSGDDLAAELVGYWLGTR